MSSLPEISAPEISAADAALAILSCLPTLVA